MGETGLEFERRMRLLGVGEEAHERFAMEPIRFSGQVYLPAQTLRRPTPSCLLPLSHCFGPLTLPLHPTSCVPPPHVLGVVLLMRFPPGMVLLRAISPIALIFAGACPACLSFVMPDRVVTLSLLQTAWFVARCLAPLPACQVPGRSISCRPRDLCKATMCGSAGREGEPQAYKSGRIFCGLSHTPPRACLHISNHISGDIMTDSPTTVPKRPRSDTLGNDESAKRVRSSASDFDDDEAFELDDDPEANAADDLPSEDEGENHDGDEEAEQDGEVPEGGARKGKLSAAQKKKRFEDKYGNMTPEDALGESLPFLICGSRAHVIGRT